MVNEILPTSIIKDNPNIKYKPYLEYLVGDNLFKDVNSLKNEQKKFLCKNVLFNKSLIEIDKVYVDIDLKNEIKYNDTIIQLNEDNNIFDKYDRVQSDFIILQLSYEELINYKLLSTKQDTYCIIPITYKDFYDDINFDHMINDYSSFSFIFDFSKGTVYINDVLLNKLKMNYNKKFDLICNVIYKYNNIDFSEKIYNEFANDNCKKILNIIYDNKEVQLKLDYLPNEITYRKISNPNYLEVKTKKNNYKIYIKNLPYEIYSNYVNKMNGSLFFNHKYGFFSEDKNKTAINVLAYDICINGLNKPILLSLEDNKLISHSSTRLLIAEYLKLPSIPVIIYQQKVDKDVKFKNQTIIENEIKLDESKLSDILSLKEIL